MSVNRKKQIAAVQHDVEIVAANLEALIEELQEAYDNMPESIQMGERGDAAQDRIQTLETWLENLNDIVGEEI